jgi:hypothetical protein
MQHDGSDGGDVDDGDVASKARRRSSSTGIGGASGFGLDGRGRQGPLATRSWRRDQVSRLAGPCTSSGSFGVYGRSKLRDVVPLSPPPPTVRATARGDPGSLNLDLNVSSVAVSPDDDSDVEGNRGARRRGKGGAGGGKIRFADAGDGDSQTDDEDGGAGSGGDESNSGDENDGASVSGGGDARRASVSTMSTQARRRSSLLRSMTKLQSTEADALGADVVPSATARSVGVKRQGTCTPVVVVGCCDGVTLQRVGWHSLASDALCSLQDR